MSSSCSTSHRKVPTLAIEINFVAAAWESLHTVCSQVCPLNAWLMLSACKLQACVFWFFTDCFGWLLTLRLLMSYIYGAPILDVSRSHTTTHHSRYDYSGRVISSSQRPLPDNTRHSQQTNIHAPGGIRTQDLSRRAAAGRSPAEIVGSNPNGGMDICLLWVSCVVR